MATGGVCEVEVGTDETFDLLCSVCNKNKRNTEAEKFCLQCHEYYCYTCSVKVHEETPSLKTHNILDKRQFWSVSRAKLPSENYERCKAHKHKTVDIYCKQCDILGCLDCMLKQHRACKDEFCVLYDVEYSTIANSTKVVTEKLAAKANYLEELQNAFMYEKEKINSSKENSLKQIKQFRLDINRMLDEMERDTVKTLEQRVQPLIDRIEAKLRELKAQTAEVQSARDSLARAGGNMAKIFASINRANEVDRHSEEIQVSSTQISFAADPKLAFMSKEVHLLGSVNLTEGPKYQPHTVPFQIETGSQNRNTSLKSQPRSSLLQITKTKRYTVNVDSDHYTCNICSVCTLPDGTIILVDDKNNRLKRLDSYSFAVIDYCNVTTPWQVCAISNQEAGVSCYKSKAVQLVTVGQKMEQAKRIKTGFECFGLASADNKLYISDNNSVYVYTVAGEKLQQFIWDKSKQGLRTYIKWPYLFSNIINIAVSIDKFKIHITDKKKGLITLDENGEIIGQYNGPKLQGAHGVCLGKNESVLVHGMESENLLQFSKDGKLIGEVFSKINFQTVFYNTKNSKLIVGFYNCSEIEVCDVSEE